jgi:D-alanyl-D-alanine carboxypeptidase/D-alanyl-D-alanine-endopeptidase (penicillin-binding protein 4)
MRTRLSWIIAGTISIGLVAAARAPRAAVPEQLRAAPAVSAALRPAAVGSATLELRNDLEGLLRSPGWSSGEWSVTIVSLTRGDTLFTHGSDVALAPASTMKLFTTSAALYYLGPDFRYTTFLLGDGKVENGVLHGNLIVYGTGDPTFSGRFGRPDAAFREFADSLAAQGITKIDGDVIGDASYFPGRNSGIGWEHNYIGASYAVPASALSLRENLITLRITPGAVGSPPSVTAVPGGSDLGIENQATTVARGRSYIDASRADYEMPLVIRGQIARGTTVQRTVPVGDPAQYAASEFLDVLRDKGITVTGRTHSVLKPEESAVTGRSVFAPAFDKQAPLRVLALHRSRPILDVLQVINHVSHNMMAEQTLRTVGRVAFGDGTIEGGYKAIRYMLECETPGDSVALQMFDGSGLSPLNRVTSRTMVRLLSFMYHSKLYEPLEYTLNIAGKDRHLRRMFGTPAYNNLKAKTGTIDHVSALGGYVTAANGEMLAFSIISNNVPSTWKAKRIEDGIGARLAGFSRPANEVGPVADNIPTGAPNAQPPIPEDGSAAVTAAAPAAAAPQRPGVADEAQADAPEPVEAAPARLPSASEQVAASLARSATKAGKGARAAAGKSSVSVKSGARYVVRQGDTLGGIARDHGVSLRALQRANPGFSARRMRPGKVLKIPAR